MSGLESRWLINIARVRPATETGVPARFTHVAEVRLGTNIRERAEREFIDLWCERFPAVEGWRLTLTYWEIVGHTTLESPQKEPIPK